MQSFPASQLRSHRGKVCLTLSATSIYHCLDNVYTMLPSPVSFAFQDSFVYVYVCFGCATAHVHREGTGSPGAGITGHGELPEVGAGTNSSSL